MAVKPVDRFPDIHIRNEFPEGNLQRSLAVGAFDPYHGELGDGKMAALAAQELRTGKDVAIPEKETPPSDAERAFALMKELIALLSPSSGLRGPCLEDANDWVFDKKKNKWIIKPGPKAKKKAAKKAKKKAPAKLRKRA